MIRATGSPRDAARAYRRLQRPLRKTFGRRSPQFLAAKKGRRQGRAGKFHRVLASPSFQAGMGVAFSVIVTALIRSWIG